MSVREEIPAIPRRASPVRGAERGSLHSMTQIPLFPDPADHQAFVRYVGLPWPMVGTAYGVVCPGCPDMTLTLWADYEAARHVALQHRLDEDAWIPAMDLPFGPRELWGARRNSPTEDLPPVSD